MRTKSESTNFSPHPSRTFAVIFVFAVIQSAAKDLRIVLRRLHLEGKGFSPA